jgi:hypothetical protein
VGTPHVFNQPFLPDTGVIPHVYPEIWSAVWYYGFARSINLLTGSTLESILGDGASLIVRLGGSVAIVASLLEEGEVGIRKRSVRMEVNDAVDRRRVILRPAYPHG